MRLVTDAMPTLQIKRWGHAPILMITVSEIHLDWQGPVTEDNCRADTAWVGGGGGPQILQRVRAETQWRATTLAYLS